MECGGLAGAFTLVNYPTNASPKRLVRKFLPTSISISPWLRSGDGCARSAAAERTNYVGMVVLVGARSTGQ